VALQIVSNGPEGGDASYSEDIEGRVKRKGVKTYLWDNGRRLERMHGYGSNCMGGVRLRYDGDSTGSFPDRDIRHDTIRYRRQKTGWEMVPGPGPRVQGVKCDLDAERKVDMHSINSCP